MRIARDELARLTRAIVRQTGATVHWRDRVEREIIVALRPAAGAEPARICFTLAGTHSEFAMPVVHAFHQAVAAAGRELIPRTLKTVIRPVSQPRYKKTSEEHAEMYGLTAAVVSRLRREGAPLDNPDAMGEALAARHRRPGRPTGRMTRRAA